MSSLINELTSIFGSTQSEEKIRFSLEGILMKIVKAKFAYISQEVYCDCCRYFIFDGQVLHFPKTSKHPNGIDICPKCAEEAREYLGKFEKGSNISLELTEDSTKKDNFIVKQDPETFKVILARDNTNLFVDDEEVKRKSGTTEVTITFDTPGKHKIVCLDGNTKNVTTVCVGHSCCVCYKIEDPDKKVNLMKFDKHQNDWICNECFPKLKNCPLCRNTNISSCLGIQDNSSEIIINKKKEIKIDHNVPIYLDQNTCSHPAYILLNKFHQKYDIYDMDSYLEITAKYMSGLGNGYRGGSSVASVYTDGVKGNSLKVYLPLGYKTDYHQIVVDSLNNRIPKDTMLIRNFKNYKEDPEFISGIQALKKMSYCLKTRRMFLVFLIKNQQGNSKYIWMSFSHNFETPSTLIVMPHSDIKNKTCLLMSDFCGTAWQSSLKPLDNNNKEEFISKFGVTKFKIPYIF